MQLSVKVYIIMIMACSKYIYKNSSQVATATITEETKDTRRQKSEYEIELLTNYMFSLHRNPGNYRKIIFVIKQVKY